MADDERSIGSLFRVEKSDTPPLPSERDLAERTRSRMLEILQSTAEVDPDDVTKAELEPLMRQFNGDGDAPSLDRAYGLQLKRKFDQRMLEIEKERLAREGK